MDNLPPHLQELYDESIKAEERVKYFEGKLRKARKTAKEAHITFDNALQEHLGQTTLLDLLEEAP